MKEFKKIEVPSCGCGRVDLYEEMLRQQEQGIAVNTDVPQVYQIIKPISTDSAKKGKKPNEEKK